jgi:hypothetical protein
MKDIETIKTTIFACVLFGLYFVLAVTSGSAQNVSSDYDTKAELSSYKIYAWTECKRPANSKLNHEQVIAKIGHNSPSSDYGKSTKQADPYLSYHGGIEDCVSYEADSSEDGGTVTPRHQEATLAIALIDRKTMKLVWVGRAAYTLSDNTETNDRRIDQAISKIFKMYPPK